MSAAGMCRATGILARGQCSIRRIFSPLSIEKTHDFSVVTNFNSNNSDPDPCHCRTENVQIFIGLSREKSTNLLKFTKRFYALTHVTWDVPDIPALFLYLTSGRL